MLLSAKGRVMTKAYRACNYFLRSCIVYVFLFFLYVILTAIMYCHGKYRIKDLKSIRRYYRQLKKSSPNPVIIVSNHITYIDSLILMWAFSSIWGYLRHFRSLVWNIPEVKTTRKNIFYRVVSYIGRCYPISRSAVRQKTKSSMKWLQYLLKRGDFLMIFPEGKRTLSNRIELGSVGYGLGELLLAAPNARVLCAYQRGHIQQGKAAYPERGNHFSIKLDIMKPSTILDGIKAKRDLTLKVMNNLIKMEEEYFADTA